MAKGKILTITGNDLSGKATQAKLLAKALGCPLFSFPNYGTVYGQLIKAALSDNQVALVRDSVGNISTHTSRRMNKTKMSPYEFQCLNLLNRLEAQEEILEALDKYPFVVMDRYDVDGYVYGAVDGCNEWWLEEFQACIKRSDLVIYLRSPRFDRVNDPKDLNEQSQDYQDKIRDKYEELLDKKGWEYVIVTTEEDPLTSIYKAHKQVILKANIFYGKDTPEGFINAADPLTKEEIEECLKE